jgi:hypothetical protein
MPTEEEAAVPAHLFWLMILAAAVVGSVLRVRGLPDQIPLGDELHGVFVLLTSGYLEIFTHFFESDVCIPLTLISKLFADTMGLDEITLRIVPLLSGIAMIIIVPALTRRWIGDSAALVLAGLLAVSPILVFFSRNARPYAVSTLLVSIFLLGLARWCEIDTRRLRVGIVASGVGAIYFHLVAAPVVIAPLLLSFAISWRRTPATSGGASRSSHMRVGAWMLLWLVLLLAPALLSSGELVAEKAMSSTLKPKHVVAGVPILLGTTTLGGSLLMLGLIGIGIWQGVRRWGAPTLLCLSAIGAQIAALAVVEPYRVFVPWIFARYCVWLVPILLVFAASGVAWLTAAGGLRFLPPREAQAASVGIGIALCTLLYLAGPLPRIHYSPNDFAAQASFQSLDSSVPLRERAHPPRFYEVIGQEADDFAIVEAPWSWRTPGPYHHYQAIHGKRVRVGLVGELVPRSPISELPARDDRLRFASQVDISRPEALRTAGIRYVVLHRRGATGGFNPALDRKMTSVIEFYRNRVGPPVYVDERISVFRVDHSVIR